MNRRNLLTGAAATAFACGLPGAQANQRRMRPVQRPGVYVEELPAMRSIESARTDVTMFIGHFSSGLAAGASVQVGSTTQLPQGFSNVSGLASQFFVAGGEELILVNAALRSDGTADYETVLDQLASDNDHRFSLLLLVGAEALHTTDSARLAVLYNTAADVARGRFGMLIVEGPDSATGHGAWLSALRLDNPDIAIWGPHLRALDGQISAPGPTIAGIIAQTDDHQGVWKAPAGVGATILGYQATHALNQNQLQTMNQLNINPIWAVNGRTVLWGARTISSDPEWKYIPVRRLARSIENSVSTSLQWVVFEPNNEHLWSTLRNMISGYLNDLWRQGAFQGSRSEHAFFVRCDRSTMTDQDLRSGLAVVEMGFAPVRPAEFVIIRLSALTADAN